ncbi:hypothetical protein GCM10010331_71430 [Streptomyces xanthochromogenes]|nr:hypothetical protein GCM10010331_71430 [Streptomyces xanthochromogenes]
MDHTEQPGTGGQEGYGDDGDRAQRGRHPNGSEREREDPAARGPGPLRLLVPSVLLSSVLRYRLLLPLGVERIRAPAVSYGAACRFRSVLVGSVLVGGAVRGAHAFARGAGLRR